MPIFELLLLVALGSVCVCSKFDICFGHCISFHYQVISLNTQQRSTTLLLEILAFCTAFTERDNSLFFRASIWLGEN